MKLKNFLVKLWYKIPRFKLVIKLQRKDIDNRAFDWYLSRQKYGFDERIMWDLSSYNDDRIRKTLNIPPSEHDHVGLEQFSSWIKNPLYEEDVKWFYDRVCKYIEWECPYSFYEKKHLYDSTEIKKILTQYKSILEAASKDMIISDDEIKFLFKYNRFFY